MQNEKEIEQAIYTASNKTEKVGISASHAVQTIEQHFDDTDPEWEFYLQRVAEAAPSSAKNLVQSLRVDSAWGIPLDEITPGEYSLENRWGFLFTLCKSYLRSGLFQKAVETLDDYANEFEKVDGDFKNRGMYKHLRSEILRNIGGEENIRDAFKLALETNNVLHNHAGIQNNIGEIISISVLEGYPLSDIHLVAESQEQLIRFGLELVNDAVDKHGEVPTYHVTLGRLLAHQGNFAEAREEIREGIRLADPDREIYNTRLSEYQRYLSQIELQHQQQEVEDLASLTDSLEGSLENAKSEISELQENSKTRYTELESKYNNMLREFQTRNLQFIGFFAGLIAVTIAIVDIAISMPYPEAAGLVLILVGGLLVAFAGFRNILPKLDSGENGAWEPMLVNLVIGLLLIGGGLAVPSFIPL